MSLRTSFHLVEGLDLEKLRADYKQNGYIRIHPFLNDAAVHALRHDLLAREEEWIIVINSGDKLFEMSYSAAADLSDVQRAGLDSAVYEAARHSFQFRYSAIRVPDEIAARNESARLLDQFVTFMSSSEVLDLVRFITDCEVINFADGQATRYGSGDFLTSHNDSVPGKNRHAAYVLGLTEGWRTEWGGLLQYHHERCGFSGFAPAFNTLDLFRVPQLHSVSYVAPYAGTKRTSVTGWFRSLQP